MKFNEYIKTQVPGKTKKQYERKYLEAVPGSTKNDFIDWFNRQFISGKIIKFGQKFYDYHQVLDASEKYDIITNKELKNEN